MRAKGTWVLLFFVASSALVAFALHFAFRDLFSVIHVDNFNVLGNFKLSSLIATSIALVLGLFFGVFYKNSRRYIEQCVVEFNKVAYPEWKETKTATFTVVFVSLVASAILGVMDMFFAWWTNNNLFIW